MYARLTENRPFKAVIILAPLIAGCVLIGKSIAAFDTGTAMTIAAVAMALCLAFINFEYVLYLIILAMLFSPEIIVGRIPGRDIVIRIEDLCVIFAGVAMLLRMSVSKETREDARNTLTLPILFYSAVFIFSTGRGMMLAGVNPFLGAFFILKYLEYFMIYFIISYFVRDGGQLRRFTYAFLITFFIVNIYGYSQFGLIDRISAPFEGAGEPNTLGGYQVLIMAIISGLFVHSDSGKFKLILCALVLFAIPPFLRTFSRASYLAIIIMFLALIAVTTRKRVFLMGIFLAAVIAVFFFIPREVSERVKYTFTPEFQEGIPTARVFGVNLGPSASARMYTYHMALRMWQKAPFFGYGVTGTGFIDSQYFRTLAEMGAVGLFALIFLIISLFAATRRIYLSTEDKFFKGLTHGFLAGQVGMAVHAMTANTYTIVRIMEPFWFIAAMVMAIPRLKVDGESAARQA